MKKKSVIAILSTTIIVGIIIVCYLLNNTRDNNEPQFPEPPLEMLEAEEEPYTNSVRGHDERDQIIGNFSGKMIDTLTVVQAAHIEYVDTTAYVILDGERFKASEVDEELWKYEWDVVSSMGSVPHLRVFGLCPQLVFEGDLDNNGTDEFGILQTWIVSFLRSYRVYTFYQNEWRYLFSPFGTAESLRASGKELVKPGQHKGEIIVTKSDFDAELSSFACAPDKDTVVKSTYLKIE